MAASPIEMAANWNWDSRVSVRDNGIGGGPPASFGERRAIASHRPIRRLLTLGGGSSYHRQSMGVSGNDTALREGDRGSARD